MERPLIRPLTRPRCRQLALLPSTEQMMGCAAAVLTAFAWMGADDSKTRVIINNIIPPSLVLRVKVEATGGDFVHVFPWLHSTSARRDWGLAADLLSYTDELALVGGPPGANVTPASPLHSLTRATAGTNWTQTIRWLDFPVITGRRWGSLLAVVRVHYTNYDSVLIIPTAEAELRNDGVKWRPRQIFFSVL